MKWVRIFSKSIIHIKIPLKTNQPYLIFYHCCPKNPLHPSCVHHKLLYPSTQQISASPGFHNLHLLNCKCRRYPAELHAQRSLSTPWWNPTSTSSAVARCLLWLFYSHRYHARTARNSGLVWNAVVCLWKLLFVWKNCAFIEYNNDEFIEAYHLRFFLVLYKSLEAQVYFIFRSWFLYNVFLILL